MIPLPHHQGKDLLSSARNDKSRGTLCDLHQSFIILVLLYIFLISYLVQLHVGQAGSCAASIFLWIGHCVAVQSQQLLQRKLRSLQGVTEGLKTPGWEKWVRGITETLKLVYMIYWQPIFSYTELF